MRLLDTAGASDTMSDDTMIEMIVVNVNHNNNEGTEEFEGLRVMCYERADVFIVCYSLAKPASASNVRLLK